MMYNSITMSDNFHNPGDDDEGGWRRRFKGKVELLRHVDDRIEVMVQLYSLPRPPDSEFSRNPLSNEEQVLFLSTADPAYRLLLRVVATRSALDAATTNVTVEAHSNRLADIYEAGRLDIRLSADNYEFSECQPSPFGCMFSDVPIAALGRLRISVTVKIQP